MAFACVGSVIRPRRRDAGVYDASRPRAKVDAHVTMEMTFHDAGPAPRERAIPFLEECSKFIGIFVFPAPEPFA